MKCKWNECENEARLKSPFCSGTCKKRHARASGTNVPVEVGQMSSGTQAGQHDNITILDPGFKHVLKVKLPPFYIVPDQTVYGRRAACWDNDQWATRPEPLNITDKPHSGGRGKYTRNDGTVYQFDCMGTAFNVIDGKVYQSIDEVKACYI